MRKPVNQKYTEGTRLLAAAGAAFGAAALLAGCGSSSRSSAPPSATTTPVLPTTSTPAPATTAPGTTTTKTPSTLSPTAKLILALGKPPKNSTMPLSLRGSRTGAVPLSDSSRKHHAAGAIATTNGGALVGYLVFKNRKDALADLAANPPNTGPNKIIGRSLSGLPQPTYVLKALGNGYVVRYVVFVDGPVIVNAWAYGQKGKAAERKLLTIVEENARWARGRLAAARKTAG
jgi:hypothetical protein